MRRKSGHGRSFTDATYSVPEDLYALAEDVCCNNALNLRSVATGEMRDGAAAEILGEVGEA